MLDEMKPERVPLQVGWTERVPVQVGWAMPASGPRRTRWEYLSLQTDNDAETVMSVRGEAPPVGSNASIRDVLEVLGADDWELVAVAPHISGGFLYVFKRPVMKH